MPPRKQAATRRAPRRRAAPAPEAVDTSRAPALAAALAGVDKKAEEPAVLDLRGLSSYADYVVLLSADNPRQIEAVQEAIETRLRAEGRRPLGEEGSGASGWMLLDYGDIVVHVLSPEARAFYDLEGLWGDAPRVPVEG